MDFFLRLFGKPKEEPSALPTLAKLQETLEMLEKKEGLMQKKVTQEMQRAKEFTQLKNKRAAIQCLKRKKMYEQQAENLTNYQLRIHDQMILLDSAKATTEVVEALRFGAAAVKNIQKQTNIDHIDETIDEINQMTEKMKEVQQALAEGGSGICEFDDDELAAELDELEAEELDDLVVPENKPSVAAQPNPPAGTSTGTHAHSAIGTEDEDEELKELRKEMTPA